MERDVMNPTISRLEAATESFKVCEREPASDDVLDLLEMNFNWLIAVLDSPDLHAEIAGATGDSIRRLDGSLAAVFADLGNVAERRGDEEFAGAMKDVANEIRGYNPDPAEFLLALQGFVKNLKEVAATRGVYMESARDGGFEAEYVAGLRAGGMKSRGG